MKIHNLSQQQQRLPSGSSSFVPPRLADFRLPALALLLPLALLLCGCASQRQIPPQRYEAAKALFDQTTKMYHLPSAEAKGAEQDKLRNQAARGYTQLLKDYPDQADWCAQARRSLGNIRAVQGRLDEAVKHYTAVGQDYPGQEWEVLQAWKSAADLLWEAGRTAEARPFYENIIQQYDRPDAPAVVKLVVRGARSRLAEGGMAK
jgi:tetratricopeptide (TPR) repeat protein